MGLRCQVQIPLNSRNETRVSLGGKMAEIETITGDIFTTDAEAIVNANSGDAPLN